MKQITALTPQETESIAPLIELYSFGRTSGLTIATKKELKEYNSLKAKKLVYTTSFKTYSVVNLTNEGQEYANKILVNSL